MNKFYVIQKGKAILWYEILRNSKCVWDFAGISYSEIFFETLCK
jgi:hypothetical protein